MKVLITGEIPENILPKFLAERLIGCEVDLSSMANPEGKDPTEGLEVIYKSLGLGVDHITHEIDVEMMLAAVKEKHGDNVYDDLINKLSENLYPMFLISTINIPISYCQIVHSEPIPPKDLPTYQIPKSPDKEALQAIYSAYKALADAEKHNPTIIGFDPPNED